MALMPVLGGSVASWCYRALGGIRPDPAAPGYDNVTIRPSIVRGLDWVECHHDGTDGCISNAWKRTGERIDLDVVIPANSTGTVVLPGEAPQNVPSGRHRLTCRAPANTP